MEKEFSENNKLKTVLSKYAHIFILAIIVIQPVLDVLSFWASKFNFNMVTTLLRVMLLGIIILYGFIISNKKKAYIIYYACIALYWILHVINCFRIGYQNPISDLQLFIKLSQVLLLALPFITVLKQNKKCKNNVYLGSTIAFFIIIIFDALAYMTGTAENMYYNLGIKGWFYSGNAQGAIIAVLVALALIYANKSKKNLLFVIITVLGFGLLYVSGTRVTLISIFILGGSAIVIQILSRSKKILSYVAICVVLVVAGCLYVYSPAMQQIGRKDTSNINAENNIEDSLNNDTDKVKESKLVNSIKEDKVIPGKPYTLKQYAKIYAEYEWVYTDAIDKYGFENFLEYNNYTTSASELSDMRRYKQTIADIEWRKADFITKLVGFENDTLVINNKTYMLENDWPIVMYCNGYIGLLAYILFILYFAVLILKCIFKDFKNRFSFEIGFVGVTIVLMLFMAQFAGYILQMPNVSIYLALLLAIVYYISVEKYNENPTLGLNKLFKKKKTLVQEKTEK